MKKTYITMELASENKVERESLKERERERYK